MSCFLTHNVGQRSFPSKVSFYIHTRRADRTTLTTKLFVSRLIIRVVIKVLLANLTPECLYAITDSVMSRLLRNNEVLQRTGLTSLCHLISRRRISVFGHVARLDDVTPANMALQLHIWLAAWRSG